MFRTFILWFFDAQHHPSPIQKRWTGLLGFFSSLEAFEYQLSLIIIIIIIVI